MPRIRVNDVIRATGLSRATVDRALNRRGGLHPDTERLVHDAYQRLRLNQIDVPPAHASAAALPMQPVDAVLRMGRGLTEQILQIRARYGMPVDIVDVFDRDDAATLAVVQGLCRSTERSLILTVKNTEPVLEELVRARRRGKRVVALVSDLSPEARDVYVGIDNRKAGQAAAYIVGQAFQERPAKVGVVLGDYAFRCHEDREIGFRSYLRTAFPHITLTDVVKGDDSAEKTRDAVSDLVRGHPDLAAIYNVAGGNAGLAAALDAEGRANSILVITHETNAITLPLIRRGLVNFLVAQSPYALLNTALQVTRHEVASRRTDQHLLDFTIHSPFNIPTSDHI